MDESPQAPASERLTSLAAIEAASRRDWPTLAQAITDLAGTIPGALQTWGAATAAGIIRDRPARLAYAFDEETLGCWCADQDLPDLADWIRLPAAPGAPLQVTAADMADATRIGVCLASGDAATARAVTDAVLSSGDHARIVRLMGASAITAAAFREADRVAEL